MSNFTLLSTDVGMWDASTKAMWDLLNFCPVVMWFQVCKHSWLPSPRQSLGEIRKASMGYDIHVSSAKPCHRVQTDLQPNCQLGPSPPSPPPHSGRSGPQTDFAGWQRHGLAVCLHADEWCHVPHASAQQGTHWCYDRWSAQHKCLWLSLPVVSMKVTAKQGLGGLPRRTKWGLKALQFNFEELTHWNAAAADEPTQDPLLIEVDFSEQNLWI